MDDLCRNCGLHRNKWSSILFPCFAGLEHEASLEAHELSDVENIVRRATAGRDLAIDNKDGAQVDNFDAILTYAKGLLPEGSRFK